MPKQVSDTQYILSAPLRRGALVRWIVDYRLLAADHKGNVWPHNPKYEYGIVTEVSKADPSHLIVLSTESGYYFTAQLGVDEIEIISNGAPRVLAPTSQETRKYEK